MSLIFALTELYYPEETSTGYIFTQLCEALGEHYTGEGRNSVVIVRCSGSSFDKNSLMGRLVNVFTRTLSILRESLKRCRAGDILLVVTNPPTLPIVALLISKLKRGKYVLIVHDVYPDVLDVIGYGRLMPGLKFLWRQVNYVVYHSASKVVVLGRDMSQRISHSYHLDDDSKPVDSSMLVCVHH